MDEEHLRRNILMVVTIGSFLIPFMSSSLSIALPSIQKDFLLSLVFLSWIPTAFVLANAAFILPFGRMGDIYGRKKIFFYGVILYTLSSFLAAISPSGILLLLFSFLQGLGCSMIFATAVALISSVFPAGGRGGAIGIYVTSVYFGLFLGPLVGGFLTQNLGWRSIFLINVFIGIILIFIILWRLEPEWRGAKDEKLDITGSIIFIFTILTLISGLTMLQGYWGMILILAGILGLLIFWWWDRRSESPLLNIGIFKNRVSASSSISMLLMNTATSGMWTLLSLYLQYIKLLTPQFTGIVLVLQPLVVSLISPFIGRLSDTVKTMKLPAMGMAITTGGLLIFTFISDVTSLTHIILGLILVGIGLAIFSSPTTNNYMNSVEKKIYGVASATFSTMIFTGQVLSLVIVILVFANYVGTVSITPDYYPSFLKSVGLAFIVFSAISFGGIFVSLASGKK